MEQNAHLILKNLSEDIVDNVVMIKVSTKAQAFIRQRVFRAQYLEGSTGTSLYSTTPMPVPYGAFVKKLGKSFLKQRNGRKKDKQKLIGKGKSNFTFADPSEFNVFRSKSGKVMVLIQGGYKRWRELNKKTSGPVTMTWSGRMMRNLGILRVDKNTSEIGFSSLEESTKAYYAHAGAGKKKVTHKFMDITNSELDELGDLAEQLIFQKLQ